MQVEMREKYRVKQDAILQRLAALKTVLLDPSNWWWQSVDLASAVKQFESFAGNIEHNFGATSPCYARIADPARRDDWRVRQCAAITGLHANQQNWAKALQMLQAPA